MRHSASSGYTQAMNSTPLRWLLLGFCVALGVLAAFALSRRVARAGVGNPWTGQADLPTVVHSVSRPKEHHWAPDIGYVTDADHNVVCYFFRAHHWWDGQAHLSCVHVANDFLLEEVPG